LKPWLVNTALTLSFLKCIQGDIFPEISKKVNKIKEILDEEEESFSRTLDRGEKLFHQFATHTQEQGLKELSGKDVWRLYDTFGFPVDLTRLMVEELGLGINDSEFEAAQAWSKDASKASQTGYHRYHQT
jgi:alanyl-tRNA synthetase